MSIIYDGMTFKNKDEVNAYKKLMSSLVDDIELPEDVIEIEEDDIEDESESMDVSLKAYALGEDEDYDSYYDGETELVF